jgi:hypothetical protein
MRYRRGPLVLIQKTEREGNQPNQTSLLSLSISYLPASKQGLSVALSQEGGGVRQSRGHHSLLASRGCAKGGGGWLYIEVAVAGRKPRWLSSFLHG